TNPPTQFRGILSAHGGQGFMTGGAGTIYTHQENGNFNRLRIDNAGFTGGSTPIPPFSGVGLTVINGAGWYPPVSGLRFSNLLVDSGATLGQLPTGTNLDLTVFGNARIGTNASISLDGQGFRGANPGPGAGVMVQGGSGSGGGHGGAGGASASGTPGGNA